MICELPLVFQCNEMASETCYLNNSQFCVAVLKEEKQDPSTPTDGYYGSSTALDREESPGPLVDGSGRGASNISRRGSMMAGTFTANPYSTRYSPNARYSNLYSLLTSQGALINC